MVTFDALELYREMACSRQWRGFLRALGAEFESALPPQELDRLMARVGERFADAHPLPAVPTLEALEQGCNQVWRELGWGQVVFVETEVAVEIQHVGSPLASAFGQATAWPQGFLLGVYRRWMRSAGMLPGLDVRLVTGGTEDVLLYRLARVA